MPYISGQQDCLKKMRDIRHLFEHSKASIYSCACSFSVFGKRPTSWMACWSSCFACFASSFRGRKILATEPGRSSWRPWANLHPGQRRAWKSFLQEMHDILKKAYKQHVMYKSKNPFPSLQLPPSAKLEHNLVFEKSGCSRNFSCPCAKVQKSPRVHPPTTKNLQRRVCWCTWTRFLSFR